MMPDQNPRPQHLDEAAIRALSDRFADAANRVNGDDFAALWTDDAVWTIGPPIDQQFDGRETITQAFIGLLQTRWEFFIQMPAARVYTIDGDHASGRCYVNEIARAKDGTANYNLAVYEDQVMRGPEGWQFTRRDYKVLYLDETGLGGHAFQRQAGYGQP
jgi:ketosteroid isomerase-like protein